jgi:hypothetical protein
VRILQGRDLSIQEQTSEEWIQEPAKKRKKKKEEKK